MSALVDLSALGATAVSTVADYLSVDPSAGRFSISATDPSHIIAEARSGMDVHFISSGKWSLHDLVVDLLEDPAYSPAELYLSTYSITEFSARILAKYVGDGVLSSLHVLLDKRAQVRYPEVYQLSQNISTRIRLAAVHAKVFVLRSAERCTTVVGSANWTQNPRIEAGVISANPKVGDFHVSWLDKSIEYGDPFN